MIPDRSKANIFTRGLSQDRPLSPSYNKIDKLIEDGDISSFTYKDWIKYFTKKAEEHDVAYVRSDNIKESAIVKSLMKKFQPSDIRNMIDFLWDAPHTIVKDKDTLTIFHLSGGWLSGVYNQSRKWIEGQYQTENKKKRFKREWDDTNKKKPTIKFGG
jgi:hypothetical protein